MLTRHISDNSIKRLVDVVVLAAVASILLMLLTYFLHLEQGWFKAMSNFFVGNTKILDVYWNTLLILLTIMIPVSLEAIKLLQKLFPKFGTGLYLYGLVQIEKFYLTLPIFSFTLLILTPSDFHISGYQEVGLIVIHVIALAFWVVLFWDFVRIFTGSVALLSDRNDGVNKLLHKDLSSDEVYKNREDTYEVVEKWIAVWKTFGLIREKWKYAFLELFWTKIASLLRAKKYYLIDDLINNFYQEFLSSGVQKFEEKANWLNERKRWFWFHEKKFSDGKENPYSVYVRILELYEMLYKLRDEDFSKETLVVFESGLDQLYRTAKDNVEKLTRSELEESFDGHYGLFKILLDHIAPYAESENEKDKEYLANIPIYSPIFDYADKFSFQGDTFPQKWQLSAKNLDVLFGKNGDGRLRLIWLNHFLNWAGSRIGHDKKEYDSKLEGAVEMLFPKMETSWLACWIGFRTLSWGGERIESLCHWERNFGFISGIVSTHWYDPAKTDEENEREMANKDRLLREKSKEDTAKLLSKLNAFGSKGEIEKMKSHLDSLSSKFAADSNEELNRLQLIELFRYLLEFKKD